MNSETTIKENCSNCEYNRQCFIKKQLGAVECQKDKDYITNLQQENNQLKEQLEYLRSNEYLIQVKWERNFNEELVKDLQTKIDKALDMLDLIIPELWNISNAMTYKIKEVKKILGDKE